MIRKGKAVWRGTGRDGSGELFTDSMALDATAYSFRTRFEGDRGTNPEELIAAAPVGCFPMSLAFQLQAAGFLPGMMTTEAAVKLEQDGQSFTISRSDLTLHADVPGIDEVKFRELARQADLNCPVSKLMRAVITLDAHLV